MEYCIVCGKEIKIKGIMLNSECYDGPVLCSYTCLDLIKHPNRILITEVSEDFQEEEFIGPILKYYEP